MPEAATVTQVYLDLAERLYAGKMDENALPAVAESLPVLDETPLHQIARHSEAAAPIKPRRAWAIAAVADAAPKVGKSIL